MFSYLGGKKFQSKWISSHFPKNDIYVEPFGGAFWVYFQSGINSQRNIYNDKNTADVNCLGWGDIRLISPRYTWGGHPYTLTTDIHCITLKVVTYRLIILSLLSI